MRIVLIGSGDKEKPNVMSAAWCFPVSGEPAIFGVCLSKKRFTHRLVSKNKEYTINIPGEGMEETVEICGSNSGADVDKFEKAGIAPEFGKLEAPMVKECLASLELRVIDEREFGDHVIFFGEVANVVKRKPGKGIYQKGTELIVL